MSILEHLKNIVESQQIDLPKFEVDDDSDKKKEEPFTPIVEPKVDDSNKFVPKEMHWLDWNHPGFRDALLDSQIHFESGGNPYSKSPAGAVGLTQFIPQTWDYAKKMGWIAPDAVRTDPNASLQAQKGLMTQLYNEPEIKNSLTDEERCAKALAAYNAGYGNVLKAITKANLNGGYWLDYMPTETKKYVPLIMNKTEEEYFKSKENYVPKYKRD